MAEWNGTARTTIFRSPTNRSFVNGRKPRHCTSLPRTLAAQPLCVYSETDDGVAHKLLARRRGCAIEVDVVAELAAHLAEGRLPS